MARSWFLSWLQRKPQHAGKRRRFVRRLPLSLERLEDRIVPSADNWIGGSGNWDVGSNWSLGQAPGQGDTAIINTSAAATVTIQSGDAVQVQSITTASNDTLSITGGSAKVTAGASTLSGGLSMSGGSLTAAGSGVKLTANGNTTVVDASLFAEGGATMSLPQMISYTAKGNTFQADGASSVLDVSALTTPTVRGNWTIDATRGGKLDLSGLTSLSKSSEGKIFLTDTGSSTLVDNNVNTLDGVNATLDGTDTQVANSWTTFTHGWLEITGGAYSLANLTDVDASTLYAKSGGSLALPGLVSYTANGTAFSSYAYFTADGKGSVLDVSALTTPNVQGTWSINATNGGKVDLSGLKSISSSTGSVGINDTGNSTILDSNLSSFDHVTATLDGTDTQVANSWTKFTYGTLIVTDGSYSLDGLTDVDGSSLYVKSGGSLALSGLTSYTANNNTFQADGTGSVLDVSALSSLTQNGGWTVTASNGGKLNLNGLTSVGNIKHGISFNDTGNSTILDSNLSSLQYVTATLDGTDTQVANSWTKFTYGTLIVIGGSYSLDGLTDVDGSFLYAKSGGSLALPGLPSYAAGGSGVKSLFQADGSGSVLDLSALASATENGVWTVVASNGGEVKLPQLTTVSGTQGAYFNANGSSSKLDLPVLASVTGPNLISEGNGITLDLPKLTQGDIILQNGQTMTVQGTEVGLPADGASGAAINVPASQGLTVTLNNTGTLTGTTINVGKGSTVVMNGKYTGGTTFNVDAGATAKLTGGTYLDGSTFNLGQGATVYLNDKGVSTFGGTLTGTGSGSVISSGTLLAAQGGVTLNFPGNMFQWTTGGIGTSVGDVTNKGTMNFVGSLQKVLYDDGTLFNYGTIVQTGSANFSLHSDNVSPTTFVNEAGASYLIESDSGIDNYAGGQVAVQNAGTIKKTAGTGTSDLFINGPLSNTGTIEADSGTLFLDANSITQLASNTLNAGTWKALGGSAIEFRTGTSITANAADISLDGSGAAFDALDSNGNTVNVLGGLSSNSGSLRLTNGANLTTTGDLTNSGSLTAGVSSTLTVGGNFTQTADGTLNDQIGGTPSSGKFGQVAVTGTAALGGNFNVSLVNSFTPSSGQDFPVMSYASTSGTFKTVTGLSPYFTEQINPTSLDLTTASATKNVDLQLSNVTAPTKATTGQQIAVNWKVSNAGSNDASGSWQDSVYFSTTQSITGSSILLGSVTHTGGLAAGGSYSASLSAEVPALLPDNYYVLVQTDSLYQAADTDRTNNTLAAGTGQLAVSVPGLNLGTPATGTFTAADQDQYYQVTVPAGGSLQVNLTSAASSGALALYVSQGTQPTPYSYQEAAKVANQPNQSLNVPVTVAGTYYILVHSVSGAAATAGYTLTVTQTNALSVTSISSYSGGDAGTVTVEIDGTNFTPQTTATLTLGTTTLQATAIDYVSGSKLFATFDLSGAAVGNYTLSVQQGTQSATAANKFQVVPSTPSNGLIDVRIGMPQLIRAGRTATIVINYTNTTKNDIIAPLLEISSTNTNVFFSTPDDPNNFVQSAQVLAVAPNGPAGILRPGESGQLTLTLLTEGSGGDKIPVQVQQVVPGKTIDWPSLKSALQPPDIPTAAWNAIFSNVTAVVGTTTDSYNAALAQAATYLGGLGDTMAVVSDVNRLWSFLVAQANASFPPKTLAAFGDASLPVPGKLSLSIGRSFGSTIAERNQSNIFGMGWAPSWQVSMSVDPSSGNVSINTGTSLAYFVHQANGTYLGTDGADGALTFSGGIYTYTDTDNTGTQYVFNANGLLNYVQDTNGNRITLGYNGQNQIVSFTYSNPGEPSEPTEQLTLKYNAQGFVSQVSDGTGNKWSYQYDAAGHLFSVTAPGNLTTTYTYDSGSNPETANALLSITYLDGSQINYAYDPATGRLTGTSLKGGANPIAYAYPNEAEVITTDASGDQSTVWFNDEGKAARTEDPLGGISTNAYDVNGNLVASTNAAGNSYRYIYDTNGNLSQIINPLGQTVQMSYGPLDTLTSSTDAAGNTTQYKYSSAGNLLSISYPDGTQKSFTYDPLGNLSETVLQNSDPIDYQYNAQGLASKETFADGTSQTFTYDSHGNMLTANTYDSSGTLTGTTTMTYNADNGMTSIAYPNGQFLKFTYNAAGKRTQSVDQSGYTINYAYDTLGRLSKLTDGSGNLIVQYSYNNIGQLVKKVNGNGTYTTYVYDANGNLHKEDNYADSSGKTINSSFTYTYNSLNEQTSVTDAAGNVTKYGYDTIGQLTQLTLPDGTGITYAYNAAGDRTEVMTNGTATNYSSNADNEITQAGSTTYTYDANGNLKTATDASGTTTYTYNDLNQLVSITNPDGSVQNFQYSPLGYLLGTSTTSGGTTSQTNYLVDPTGIGNVVAAYDGSGSLIAHYNFGLGLVSQTGPSGTGYYDFNANGNTIGITGSNGAYVNQYSYLPFGETTTLSATLSNPFTFSGHSGVMQVGDNLFFMRARLYSPSLGQFLSNDPTGLSGGDSNIRRFVGNNPVTGADPTGTDSAAPLMIPSESGTPLPVPPGVRVSLPIFYGGATSNEQLAEDYADIYTYCFSLMNKNDPNLAGDDLAVYGGALQYATAQIDELFPGAPGGIELTNGRLTILHYVQHFLATGSCVGSGNVSGPGGGGGDGGNSGENRNFGSNYYGGTQTTTGTSEGSHDPNALYGPVGKGLYVLSGTLSYTLDFENDGTAAAQTVTATEQLDPNFDWSTFQLGSFAFGPVNITVPAGLTQYQTTIPYQNTDGTSLDVKVSLNFNVQTGLLTATFTSIDPLTGQAPTGVFDGFLPPDNSSHVGEGYVQYTVQPKSGLASGTSIRGQASVVFDTNAAIQTNTVTNTIDATPPTSSVNPLPATESSPSFTVSWSGSDPNGPGIASYTIYVSDNGGAFTPWLTNTTQTSATYSGQVGHTYSFYSVATDELGLSQSKPNAAQATTTVNIMNNGTPPVLTGQPANQSVTDVQTATFTASANGAQSVQWQVSTNGGRTWSDISRANSTTLTLNNLSLAMNGYAYRAVFSNSAGRSPSNAATLSVSVYTPASPMQLLDAIFIDYYAEVFQSNPAALSFLNSFSESLLGEPLPPMVDLMPTLDADYAALVDLLLRL